MELMRVWVGVPVSEGEGERFLNVFVFNDLIPYTGRKR